MRVAIGICSETFSGALALQVRDMTSIAHPKFAVRSVGSMVCSVRAVGAWYFAASRRVVVRICTAVCLGALAFQVKSLSLVRPRVPAVMTALFMVCRASVAGTR